MQAIDLQKYVNQVVTLDLVNGSQVTTRINKIENGVVFCKTLLVFTLSPEPRNPNLPPSPSNPIEGKVRNMPYGAPLYELPKEVKLDLAHIVLVLPCSKDMADVYTKATSGLVVAGGGTLSQLDQMMRP